MVPKLLIERRGMAHIHPGVLAAATAVSELLRDRVRMQLVEDSAPLDLLRGLRLEPSDVERLLSRPSSLAGRRPYHDAHVPFVLPDEAAGSPLDVARIGLGLSIFETAVLTLCLLPELDAAYGQLIGYLHDDVKRKQPSVELALALVAPAGSAGLRHLGSFKPAAKLLSWQLIEAPPDGALVRRTLQLDSAFLWFLLSERDLDPTLADVARVLPMERATGAPPEILEGLLARDETAGAPVLLYGEDEQACVDAAAMSAATLGRALLLIDGAQLAELETNVTVLRRCLREAILKDWLPCVTGAATLLGHTSRHAASCRQILRQCPLTAFLIARSEDGEIASIGDDIVPVAVTAPRVADRLEHWRRAASGRGIDIDEPTLLALAETTGLAGHAIEEVATVAEATAVAADQTPGGRHMQQAARSVLRRQTTSLALTTPRFGWDDLILPPDRLEMLEYLCSRVRYRLHVRETWGTGRGVLPGVTALFAGEPGTGKSMAAEVIAADLGLDLCRIDLAQVVSKYIGETEKHLARVFDEAERCGVALVFDEADALFGKRSAVKDSHDRYANIETSYLLQRMERYRGLAVLTTNLRANMDAAFTRRITVSVDFPLPAAEDRLRIWQRALAGTPCDPRLNLDQIAERLELAGGVITNVAVAAAYLAAKEGGGVDGERLGRALRWELQKMGRWMGSDIAEVFVPAATS